jgi:catechol 2,3-dioxygenase-like lactoylglutathione lyase family enzyme
MQLSIQASLVNAGNLDRSIKFYQDVLGLRRIARSDRVAALMIDETNRRQASTTLPAGLLRANRAAGTWATGGSGAGGT